MTRIAFAPTLEGTWLGGVNYYRNLFAALADVSEPRMEFLLFASPETDVSWVPASSRFRVVVTSLLKRGTAADVARRFSKRMSRRDWLLARALRAHGVDLLSHSGHLGDASTPKALGWIADLQHRHLTKLFSETERRDRDRVIEEHLHYCAGVLVSSNAARQDLLEFDPTCGRKVTVLPFASDAPRTAGLPTPDALRAKYQLNTGYFYIPNQFWAHKNHGVVVQALRILVTRRPDACVVCTGSAQDYRQPGYYNELMASAKGLEKEFRVLGVVPYADAVALMRDAMAIINPSLFEGWSTTVEEAKSFGKCIILSDIPAHKEQAPDRGRFFSPHDAEQLADLMVEVLKRFDPSQERAEEARAAAQLPERRRAFADRYIRAAVNAMTES